MEKVVKILNGYQGIPEVPSDAEERAKELERRFIAAEVQIGQSLWHISTALRFLRSDYIEFEHERKAREGGVI